MNIKHTLLLHRLWKGFYIGGNIAKGSRKKVPPLIARQLRPSELFFVFKFLPPFMALPLPPPTSLNGLAIRGSFFCGFPKKDLEPVKVWEVR